LKKKRDETLFCPQAINAGISYREDMRERRCKEENRNLPCTKEEEDGCIQNGGSAKSVEGLSKRVKRVSQQHKGSQIRKESPMMSGLGA